MKSASVRNFSILTVFFLPRVKGWPWFAGRASSPAFLKDWEIIAVSPKDAEEKLAANLLIHDTQTDLVAAELPELG